MDKYIGNKKTILESIEEFMIKKGIESGTFLDIFSGTTNVAQYFKQRGFSVISNDINEFCYALQIAYVENNTFPKFEKVLEYIKSIGFAFNESEINELIAYSIKKIVNGKIFTLDYETKTDYIQRVIPLVKVISYLNSLSTKNLNNKEKFFYDHYTIFGDKSGFKSARGTVGKRNYFNEYNAKKTGVILETLKEWYSENIIEKNEYYILLTSLIEEVTLVANVNGTFHDFNRKKLYPNAVVNMKLKPTVLNIVNSNDKSFYAFKADSNYLKDDIKFSKLNNQIDVLYIDPPYNFRQYSSYYHLLNLIGKYHEIEDIIEYGKNLSYVRGQNMQDDFKSAYCYRDKFAMALKDLILGINAKHIIISYYDENNHWNHGKEEITEEGREVILDILKDEKVFKYYDEQPYKIKRQNYQSQNGHKKKEVDELIFYAIKR